MVDTIHFFNYLNKNAMSKLNWEFNQPKITEYKSYIAGLKVPIKFYVPKSEISDILQDDFGCNKIKYIVDVVEHSDFVMFLDQLDEICVEKASINSVLWFKKQLDDSQISKYYHDIYSIDESSENVYWYIDVMNTELLSSISNYNNDNSNLEVQIIGIEFFKSSFKWKIVLSSVIDTLDTQDEDMNFTDMINNNTENTKQLNIQNNELEPVINKDIIEELANTSIQDNSDVLSDIKRQYNKDNNVVNKKMTTSSNFNIDTTSIKSTATHSKLSKNINNDSNRLALMEIESIITQKKIEADKFFTNAERARKAADSLNKKALDASNEIRKYEEKVKELTKLI